MKTGHKPQSPTAVGMFSYGKCLTLDSADEIPSPRKIVVDNVFVGESVVAMIIIMIIILTILLTQLILLINNNNDNNDHTMTMRFLGSR